MNRRQEPTLQDLRKNPDYTINYFGAFLLITSFSL